MQRTLELIGEVIASHPNDRFFADFEDKVRKVPGIRVQYRAYERAFATIDHVSWDLLKRKAIAHFRNHRRGQHKEGFFNQLNEAFAYEFLVRRGYSNIRLIPEDGASRPDLEYRDGGRQRYCEVKTIGVSEAEIARRTGIERIRGTVYTSLDSQFFGKLDSDLCQALIQIEAQGSDGLVFVIVLFDDFTLAYYRVYRRQIVNFLRHHRASEVFIKVGLDGNRRIYKPSPRVTPWPGNAP